MAKPLDDSQALAERRRAGYVDDVGGFVEARLTVRGESVGTHSLYRWLLDEPELRGKVRFSSATPAKGEMGAAAEIVIAVGGAVTPVLIRSIPVWLRQRSSDVVVTVRGPSGQRASVSVKRAKDPEGLIRHVLRATSDSDVDKGLDDGTAEPR